MKKRFLTVKETSQEFCLSNSEFSISLKPVVFFAILDTRLSSSEFSTFLKLYTNIWKFCCLLK